MDSLVAAAHPYLSQYGYKALFAVLFTESFGFLLPGETFLIGATLLAMKGQFDIIVVAGWAIMAVVLGSNVGGFHGCNRDWRSVSTLLKALYLST